MYLKIKCAHHQLSESFKDNMREYLGLEQIQSYFPILENYFNVFNYPESHTDYVWDSRFKISNILCEPDETRQLYYMILKIKNLSKRYLLRKIYF